MSFPIKMSIPKFVFTIPSTKEKVSFRPFLVGEQKSLTLSVVTEDLDTIVESIKEMLVVCSDGKVDPKNLTPYDIEYLLLMIRSKSIGESINVTSTCTSCKKKMRFSMDVTKAEVVGTVVDPKIFLTDDIGVVMRYPDLAVSMKLGKVKDIDGQLMFDTVVNCVESVWDSDEFINTKDYKKTDLEDFLKTFTIEQFAKLSNFILTMPVVRLEESIVCEHCGSVNQVYVEGLHNFLD